MIGQTLSHYRVTAALGAGGMGEVYRATDTNLHRDVAIKVLPPEVAQDAERLGRFQREAHLLASLNHPNIAAIYGLEEAAGKPFLALELVEGEDLKERLSRGAIPLDEALEIARQIAEALEEAHGKGIVHRDLKPANVKLTPDGKVKVLDFGLAKAWGGDTGSGGSSIDLSQSPTIARTGTLAGVILGTAAYMSPEQASGRAVDKRADVWSFGVVLFEMLTGRALFSGETVSEIMASVIKEEPAWERLPAGCPPAIERLLRRCLRKKPRERLQDIGDARVEIHEVQAGTTGEATRSSPDVEAIVRAGRRSRTRERWTWAAAFLAAAGLAGYLAIGRRTQVPERRPAAHFVVDTPDGLKALGWGAPAVSPDGRLVAFAATTRGRTTPTLWVRSIESLVGRELPGTEDATLPFWSPDSQSLGFFASGELRRVNLAGGAVQKLCALPEGFTAGGDWTGDGGILFSAGGMTARLYTVAASGGEAKPLTTPDKSRGETAHFWPEFLPDGRRFLFQVLAEGDHQGLHVASLDAPHERRRLLPTLTRADVQAGRLLFVRDRTLLAQPFDAANGTLVGEPSIVASSVASWPEVPSWGWFSASPGGLLAYAEGDSGSYELVWLDRKGGRLGVVGDPGRYGQLALSPDERSVAVELWTSERGSDIWTIDLARGVGTRQTFDAAGEIDPTWTSDGRELVFSSNRSGGYRPYRKPLQGNQPEVPFGRPLDGLDQVYPESWWPHGEALVYHGQGEAGHFIGTLGRTDGAEPETILERSAALDEPQVSPDERWLAYISEESGRWEVYLEPFRRPGERVRVSTGGGGQPKWRADGKELFYVAPDGRLMAVEVRAHPDRLEVALPVPLFGRVIPDAVRDMFAPTRDGQRFLVIVPTGDDTGLRIHVVTNWTSLLK